MCPDWESNRRCFGSQAHAQSTEPHQPEPDFFFSYHCTVVHHVNVLQLFKIIYLFIFTERGEGREKERERNINVRKIDWLPFSWHQPGTWPATQTCALTENRTSDLSLCRTVPNQLNHTGQGYYSFFIHSPTNECLGFNFFLNTYAFYDEICQL